MEFGHVAILLSFIQCVESYLVALKDFDYGCCLEHKRPLSEKVKTSSTRYERCQRPKLFDLIMTSHLFSEMNMEFNTFFAHNVRSKR